MNLSQGMETMRLRNLFARHTGRHVPRPAPVPVPRLAIEAPRREQPTWRERLADGVSALIRPTASGMAWLIGYRAVGEGTDEPPGKCGSGERGEVARAVRGGGAEGRRGPPRADRPNPVHRPPSGPQHLGAAPAGDALGLPRQDRHP